MPNAARDRRGWLSAPEAGDVARTVMRDATWPAFAGLVAARAGAISATGIMASFLLAPTPHDSATFEGVAVVMALAALVAGWIPARRAARVDPIVAPRAE
jgi:hypothetical protein